MADTRTTRVGRSTRRLVLPVLHVITWWLDRKVRRDDLEAGLALARRALRLTDVLPAGSGRQEWRGELLNTVGYLHVELGNLTEGRQAMESSLRIEVELDPESHETARRLSNLGFVNYQLGVLDIAEEHYRRAVALRAQAEPRSLDLAADLSALGQVLAVQGRLGEADSTFQRALAITGAEDPDGSVHAGVLGNVATLMLNRGELDEARSLFRKALDIELAGNPRSNHTAIAWSNMGLVSYALRDAARALTYFQRALAIDAVRSPYSPTTADDHNNIAMTLLDLGRFDDALHHFTSAAEIQLFQAPSSAAAAAVVHNIGYANQVAGNPEAAVEHYKRALGIDAAISRRSRDVALDLTNLGAAEHQVGNHDDAAHLLRQAVAQFEDFDLPGDLAQAATNLAVVLHRLGHLDEAIDSARDACAAAERTRAVAGHPETRERLFALHQSPFELLLDMLGERREDGDGDDAFAVAEAARARTLADLLGERQVRSSLRADGYAEQLRREQLLLAELLETRAALANSRDEGTKRVLADAAHAADDRLTEWRGKLRREHPGYADLAAPAQVTAREVRQRLSRTTLLLSYSPGVECLHLWAARHDVSEHVVLATSNDAVADLVDRATRGYRHSRDGGADEHRAQAELAEILLGQLPTGMADSVDRVVVVPAGPLFHLPFELLPWRGGLLVDSAAVSYAPSMSVLHNGIRRDGRPRKPFVGYAPSGGSLPSTRKEIQRVAAVFEASTADVHVDATKSTVATTISGARHVYFATHGVLDDEQPLRSGLWCTPAGDEDPVLRGYEMLDLSLDADVVVCSACETGLGTLLGGEGLIGLSRALFFAGARSLVVSLWPTPDIPTRRLVTRFAELTAAGVDPAEALRSAKVALRTSHPHVFGTPRTWAGFVVIGDVGEASALL